MRSTTILGLVGIALLGAGSLQAEKQQPVFAGRVAARLDEPALARQAPAAPHRAVLNRYCVTCHNAKLKTAGLLLDEVDVENVSAGAPVWEKVVRKLRTGAMPPAGLPRPDVATYDSLATYLETALDRTAAAKPNPGRPGLHRLNRAEYANAIRDLLAIDQAAIDFQSLLPADDSSYGFDNIADALSVSPTLMESYLSAARKVSRVAIGETVTRPAFETYPIPRYVIQDAQVSDDLPFGSRGGAAIRHRFPLDGEYTIKIRLQTNVTENILGLGAPRQLDIRLDGERIKLFTIGGGPQAKEDDPPTADAGLEVRFPARAGVRTVGVTFVNVASEPEGVLTPPVTDYSYAKRASTPDTEPAVASITLGGPYNAKGPGETPSRRKILVCHPTGSADELPCARRILSTLARRAYRRPATDADVETLLGFYRTGRNEGSFDAGIGAALERMLVDPEFVFRIERDPSQVAPAAAYRITDLELASRLSFFLWSSVPDDQLLDLAARGRLKDPVALEQQVRRMLGDVRSKALVSNFAGQWLYLRNVKAKWPNPYDFPDFDVNLQNALLQETELFFESLLREDRGVLNLLDADYTFVNERLARHYGIPNVYGSHFRRVALRDENRKGILGQGSILLVTSQATRTAPTIRGKFLLENILGTPPPPPPPNVPSLDEKKGQDGKLLTMRQQLEQHRANPTCASCHRLMDPLGFALENFDATGKWRTMDGNTPIDASGALPDGTKFRGPAELRNILLRHPDQFVTTVTEKLLTYALGRGVEYYDAPAIRRIVRESAPGYRWSSVIAGIVKSTPFQMRRSREP